MKPSSSTLVLAALLCVSIPSNADAQVALRTLSGTLGSGAGDVNKDGIPDLITASGSVATVVSGKDWSTLYTLDKTAFGTNTVTAVDGGTDINQDGYDDVIVGRSVASANSSNQQQGIVRVWSGKDGKLLYEQLGYWGHDRLGTSVAALGDLNNDGFPDFAAGAENAPALQDYGVVLVWSGKDGRLLYLFTGEAAPQRLGHSVRPAGDVDNDGTPDIVAGSQQRGIARVYSGKTGKQLHVFTIAGSASTVTVDGVGDVDKDGYADLLVAGDLNVVQVFSGKDGSTLFRKSGRAGSAAGDLNSDGHADFMVSFVDTVQGFSGKDGSLLFSLKNSSAGFGYFVRLVGDINRDGARDFLVGANTSVFLYSGDIRPLSVDQVEFSVSQGGQQKMFLNAGSKHGLKTYLIMGSDKGTTPGTVFGPITVPLNSGAYFLYTLNAPNTVIQGSLGSLDSSGRSTAVLTLPKKIPNSLVGRTVHHAYMAVTLAPFSFDFVSNPVPLKLLK